MIFNTILAISENGKYITQESNPLSAKINHALNFAYFSNINSSSPFVIIALVIVLVLIYYFSRKK
jgi:hypothetical protein